MDFKEVVGFFILFTLGVFPTLRSGLSELYKVVVPNKKNQNLILKEQTFINRISMSYIKKHAKNHKILVKVLIFANYLYISIILVFLFLALIYIFGVEVLSILIGILILKILILDLFIILLSVVKADYSKSRPGKRWKF